MIRIHTEIQRGPLLLDVAFESDAHVVGIFGPSGCGKSTLLHAIVGLIRPTTGEIHLNKSILFSSIDRIFLCPHERNVAMVFQENRLFPHLSTRENLLFGYERTSGSARHISVDEIIAFLELDSILHQRIHELSGGEAKRIALGRALLTSPELLLLDEPLTGLDRRLRRDILAYLVGLKERFDMRMIYVSHTLPDFLAIVEDPLRLEEGVITRIGSTLDLIDDNADAQLQTNLRGCVTEIHLHTAVVKTGDVVFRMPSAGLTLNSPALIQISADDVLLSTQQPSTLSARNILKGSIKALTETPAGVIAEVDVGPIIYAELTPDAVRELNLAPGAEVFAIIKARSIQGTAIKSARENVYE